MKNSFCSFLFLRHYFLIVKELEEVKQNNFFEITRAADFWLILYSEYNACMLYSYLQSSQQHHTTTISYPKKKKKHRY